LTTTDRSYSGVTATAIIHAGCFLVASLIPPSIRLMRRFRECFEETGIVAIPEALTSVTASPVITHKTGDLTQHIDITFRCRAVGGDARPYDGEFAEVRWYPFDDLPHMDPYDMSILRLAIERRDSAAFTFSGLTDVLGLRDDDSHRAGTY